MWCIALYSLASGTSVIISVNCLFVQFSIHVKTLLFHLQNLWKYETIENIHLCIKSSCIVDTSNLRICSYGQSSLDLNLSEHLMSHCCTHNIYNLDGFFLHPACGGIFSMKCLSNNLNGELAGSGISKAPLGVSLAFLSKCFTISR